MSTSGDSMFVVSPSVKRNPNPRAPLAAILRFSADRPVRTTVEIGDGARSWKVTFGTQHDPMAGLPLLGMRPDRAHWIEVSIVDAASSVARASRRLEYSTPSLPGGFDFPPIRVHKAVSDRMEPGVTLLSVRRSVPGKEPEWTSAQKQFAEGWGMIVAIDEQGEVVWYYQSDLRIAGIDRLRNGHLLCYLTDFRAVEIDMLGNVHWQLYAGKRPSGPLPDAVPVDVHSIHHQPHEMPSGNFLLMTASARHMPDYVSSETDPEAPRRDAMVIGDKLVEVRRSDGAVLWSWDTFDHLDPYRIGYNGLDAYWHMRGFPGHADWTHGNGVSYDERDDSVLVSLRNQDAILKIDRASGRIKWILGEPTDWGPLADRVLRPVGDLRWPYHGHNPRVTHAGTIMHMDNGIIGARPFRTPVPVDQCYTRAVEYEVDESAMTVREIWASDQADSADKRLSWAMGEAHRMPRTDNVLVIYAICGLRRSDLNPYFNFLSSSAHISQFPYRARIREYTHDMPPQVLFDVEIADPRDIVQWGVYGGLRVESLYAQGQD